MNPIIYVALAVAAGFAAWLLILHYLDRKKPAE